MVLPKEEHAEREEPVIDDESCARTSSAATAASRRSIAARSQHRIPEVQFLRAAGCLWRDRHRGDRIFSRNVDAVIFDLRENSGGNPKMVAWISSHLFDARTHLNDLYERKTNTTTEYWTQPDVPGKKLAKQPVYVLTSKATFSGAEESSPTT